MDADGPTVLNMSVLTFCQRSKYLLEQKDYEDFVKFTLSGAYNGQQVSIDPILNRMRNNTPFDVTRDYDSILGIADNIIVKQPINVFPVAKREDTLARNIHLKHQFMSNNGLFTAPVHKIPNLCIAKWGTHSMIRVLIPELYEKGRSPFLSQSEQTTFYEKGLRPAVARLCGASSAEWPPTYQDEMFRARGHNGQLSLGSKLLPDWIVPALGGAIREALLQNGCAWGTGLCFLHQIRGVKHTSIHSLEMEAPSVALEALLKEQAIDLADMSFGGAWFIDVGLEIRCGEGTCVAWRADAHRQIVQNVLKIGDGATRITGIGSSKYIRDIVSHMPSVAGCRIHPDSAQGMYNVKYLQMYTTDKALTYRPDGSHFGKYITAEDLIKGKGAAYIEGLCGVYVNAERTSNSHARIEVRVPIDCATEVLLDLTERTLRDSLVEFSRSLWWTLRTCRALAIKFLVDWQVEGSPEYRAKESALLLTAGASWLLNSLHSTPDVGQSSRELMAAILPHIDRTNADSNALAYGTPEDDSDGSEGEGDDEETSSSPENDGPRTGRHCGPTTLPSHCFGMVFLRPMRIGASYPVPRLEGDADHTLSPKSFKYFFQHTQEDLVQRILRVGAVQPRHNHRVQNRVRHAPVYVNSGQNPSDNVFSLARKGARVPPRICDGGSDIEEEGEEEEGEEGEDIDKFTTKLWFQFLLDVTTSGPNQKSAGKPGYIKLTQDERMKVNEETYTNLQLSCYFVDCQWKKASKVEWEANFNKFFPTRGYRRAGKIQNYLSTIYYPKWEAFKEKTDFRSYNLVRKALYMRFKELYWMPKAEEDRIWYTKFDPRMQKSSGIDRKIPSPRILINGIDPIW